MSDEAWDRLWSQIALLLAAWCVLLSIVVHWQAGIFAFMAAVAMGVSVALANRPKERP